MSVTAIARRYAEALADIAIQRGQTQQIAEELSRFAEMFTSNKELYDTIASPIISQRDKVKILDALIQRTRPSKVIENLLKLLLSHHRLHHIRFVQEQFRNFIDEREGVVRAHVTTASPVGDDEKEMFARQLQRITRKRIDLTFKLDPSLLGGAVTRVGSVVYDGSVRTRLEKIKHELKEGTR
jgi:F-type H+-transporting ATPase subunit delta